MKLSKIKTGMHLKATNWYADCIKKGDKFVVYEDADHNKYINCRHGSHSLDEVFADGDGNIPELELV